MVQEIEHEYRTLISEEKYTQLVATFIDKNARHLSFVNYYFDDKDLTLTNLEMVLRVRQKSPTEYKLTLKTNLNGSSLETTQKISSTEFYQLQKGLFPDGEIKNKIKDIVNTGSLHLVAILANDRLEITYENHLIVLDKSTYNNIIDYTLEVEGNTLEIAKRKFEEILKIFNIEVTKNTLTKSKRAIYTKLN